jgi:hypothetical protein
MDAICSSETSVEFKRTTQCYIPEDITLHNHRSEYLNSYEYSVSRFVFVSMASYPICTGGDCPGVKRPGCEADYSPSSSAEVKNGGAISPLPHTSSWHSA